MNIKKIDVIIRFEDLNNNAKNNLYRYLVALGFTNIDDQLEITKKVFPIIAEIKL
jgi:hypothetical protein